MPIPGRLSRGGPCRCVSSRHGLPTALGRHPLLIFAGREPVATSRAAGARRPHPELHPKTRHRRPPARPWRSRDIHTRIATGLATPEAGARLAALLERLGLPTRVGEPLGHERILAAMGSDKKNRGGGIRFALPRGVGTMGTGPEWTTEAGEPAIRAALRAIS